MENKEKSVLLIFTGGTISMAEDPSTGALRPVDFNRLQDFLPELKHTGVRIECLPFFPFIDSSDVDIDLWIRIGKEIKRNYNKFDGFVVLHGTDTMAYSASALSFMLENLAKPVIFTGSQLPVGMLRSDAKENLLTAIEIATATEEGRAIVPEVCIFFEDTLFRANRTTKKNAEHFNAFNSYNYPPLAKAGVHIKYFKSNIHYPATHAKLKLHTHFDTGIVILKIFPGINQHTVHALLSITNLKAVVLESYGAGNAMSHLWFHNELKAAVDRGIIIVNISQCKTGMVEMGRYQSSLHLLSAGVISGHDATTEAIVVKLMLLLAQFANTEQVKNLLTQSTCGEMTMTF